jgi:RNA polymerase sigma-70 factor, ECF subfamily
MDDCVAFEVLIRRYARVAYALAWRLTGNPTDAQDLVQEAFVRAFRSRHRFDGEKPFVPWLYQILRHIHLDSLKRADRWRAVSLDTLLPHADHSPNPQDGRRLNLDDLIRKDHQVQLLQVLKQLPVSYRTALMLVDLEGLSYLEVAQVMKSPVETIRTRVQRARRMLRDSYWRSDALSDAGARRSSGVVESTLKSPRKEVPSH